MAVTLTKTIDDGGIWAALSDHAAGLGAFHGSHLGNPFLTKDGVTRELLAYGADLHPPVVALHPLDASKLTQDYQEHYVYHRDNLTASRADRDAWAAQDS